MTDEKSGYEVALTTEAQRPYSQIRSQADLSSVNRIMDAFDTIPFLGHRYDPVYDAARPPFDLLVVYAGHYGIYYVVNEALRQVQIYFIEDQRRDPMRRFDA